ncbi:MAG: competence/damage-inducible protein A [Acidobacteria bacterium]|nr:competence/damage-inducible protein A [Acidobacteriota bacterium]
MITSEIIAVGSELLTPEKTDTNSLWLTETLNEIGIEVMLKTIVGDDELRLLETIKDALKRSDVVITTGGLGPTEDDLTRQIAAKALGKELVFRQDIEDGIRERFKKMGREMSETNRRQAMVIDGSDVLKNDNGTAPGLLYEEDGKYLIVLPGPPRELKPMFTEQVVPRLKDLAEDFVVKRRIIGVSGMGESVLDELVAPIYTQYSDVRTSILFNKTHVEIHLYLKAENGDEANAILEEMTAKMADALGIAVFTTKGESMEEVVGRMLFERGQTVSTAESCTGGLVGRRFTEVPGSSKYYMEGAITYSNDSKMKMLGVSAETIENHGAVSSQTAEEMAVGIRERSRTDFGISITGIAGPDGGTDEKPVGTVFVGYADANETRSIKLTVPGDRYLVRWRTSQAALDYLRRQMLKQRGRDKV